MDIHSNLQKVRNYFTSISGEKPGHKPKAHVVLRYYEQYHDKTQREIEVLSFDKPILSVFENGPFVYVAMNFHYRDDMDLRMAWNLISRYMNPLNSVSYLPEELESGYYMEGDEKKMVYFPMLEVILSPIGRESDFEIHVLNPLIHTLSYPSPTDAEPCVLQLAFDASWMNIFENMEKLDHSALRAEVEAELEHEQRH